MVLFNQKRDEMDQSESKEKVVEAEADIYRCWIKYLVYMLENSSQNLMFKSFEEQSGIKVVYRGSQIRPFSLRTEHFVVRNDRVF